MGGKSVYIRQIALLQIMAQVMDGIEILNLCWYSFSLNF